ncbi:MAG: AraC family transcriptional regulator [Verrucomicrobiota bacterium]
MAHLSKNPPYTAPVYSLLSTPVMEGVPFEIYVACWGKIISHRGHHHKKISSQYSVHIIEKGEGVFEQNGVPYPVKAGDLFLLFPGQHAFYYDLPGKPWHYTWFTLEGNAVARAVQKIGFRLDQPIIKTDYLEELQKIFIKMEAEYPHSLDYPFCSTSAAWQLIEILEMHAERNRQKNSPDIAESIRFALDHEFDHPITLKEIAHRLEISRSTLFRQFRERYHQSPKQYLETIRFNKAQQMLKTTNTPIKEIASSCGFQGDHYFNRTFRKRFGMPPGQWRKNKISKKK